jgi:hypothetical protein
MSRSGLFIFENEPIWLIYFWEWADLAYSRLTQFFFKSFWSNCVGYSRLSDWNIRAVPALRDTRVRLVVLVYCQARATPNGRLRPNAATTVDYRVGQWQSAMRASPPSVSFSRVSSFRDECLCLRKLLAQSLRSLWHVVILLLADKLFLVFSTILNR